MQTVNKKDCAAEVRSVVINCKDGQTQRFENPSSVAGCCPRALFPDSLRAPWVLCVRAWSSAWDPDVGIWQISNSCPGQENTLGVLEKAELAKVKPPEGKTRCSNSMT